MTGLEVIARADDLAPNQYTPEQKIEWLSALDQKIWNEVFAVHCDAEAPAYPEGYSSGEETLLIPAPYGWDVYSYHLLARVAEYNAEIAKYNLYATQFNAAYKEFCAWYNRTHRPRQKGDWRF